MATKRYSSPCALFTINVKVNGKQKPLVFDRYNADEKRRYIDVPDKEVQDQIEKSPDFKVYFRLDQVFEEEIQVVAEEDSQVESTEEIQEEKPLDKTPVTEEIQEEKTEEPEGDKEAKEEVLSETEENEVKKITVKNLAEAKKALNELGVPFHKLTNKEKVQTEASILGYEVEFANN